MIRVIQGKEHEEYIKLMCKMMYIEKDDMDFYINKNIENSFIYIKNNVVRIFIKEDKFINSSIIYMLQKYRFLCCTQNKNMNPTLLELLDCYLANYYSLTFAIDLVEKMNIITKDSCFDLSKTKQAIIEICNNTILNYRLDEELTISKKSGKMIACRNVLRKYNNFDIDFVRESNTFADKLEELEWFNIEEKYDEIVQAFNEYITEID